MKNRYRDKAEFLAVYVREAHPTDGWRSPGNDRVGISIKQPRAREERLGVAERCCTALEISMPLLVDEMDDRVGHAYSGMPDRLYVIDRDGRVAYKGGRGPFGFKPAEMEQALLMLLLDANLTPQPPSPNRRGGRGGEVPPASARVPLLSSEEAWRKLPAAEAGAGQPLPSWARALAGSLPRTTAAMLELDYAQRTKSPLEPALRAKLRWVAAHANRCVYGEAQALADLRRAGATEEDIKALVRSAGVPPVADDQRGEPNSERAALSFARKLTLAADTVTDEEVARLVELFGQERTVAIVLLVAYGNFQDRLILALDLPVEENGPLKPLEVRFAKPKEGEKPQPASRPTRSAEKSAPPANDARVADADWLAFDFAQLQKQMQGQRVRQPRIPVPTWDEIKGRLPEGYPARGPSRIRWSLVCLGYQPELAAAWSKCLRTFADEARQDRAFEELVFWVITRSVQCFY